MTELSQAFALAVPHADALAIRDEVGFYQAVRAVLAKGTPGERKTDEDLEHAIRQIVSKAVVSDEVVDIFAAAGLEKPDISILSDEFLAEVRGMPQRNLAVELLQKYGGQFECLDTHFRGTGDYCPLSGVEPFETAKIEEAPAL